MFLKSFSVFAFAASLSAGLCGSASAAALLTSHVPALVAQHQAALAGPVDPSTHMRMQVVLPMHNLAGLKDTLGALYNPSSPLYRHWLSVAEFTKRFGPTQKDYDAAMAFFRGQGLAVTNTMANRYMFQVEGNASDVERVLHVKMNLYKHPTENRNFMAPDREPTLSLQVPVQHITHLDNYVLPHPKLVHSDSRDGKASTGSGPDGNYIASDFRAAYYGAGKYAKLTGKGQSVGLMELEPFNPSDVALYFTNYGPANTVAVNGVGVGGAQATCTNCEDGEQELDIVYPIGMAPGLDQVQVYVSGDPVAIENQMASDNTSKQLSTSWGYDEDFADEDPIYQEMAAQGQSYFTASGDYSTLEDSGPWPEEDANIIAVGGTDLVTSGPGGTWVSEPGWEDSASGPSVDHHIRIEFVSAALHQQEEPRLEILSQRVGHLRQWRFRHDDLRPGKLPGGLGWYQLLLADLGRLQRADEPVRAEQGFVDGRLPEPDCLYARWQQQEDAARRRRQFERYVSGGQGL